MQKHSLIKSCILLLLFTFTLSACGDFASIFKKNSGYSKKNSSKSSKAKKVAPNRKGKKGKVLPGYFKWPLHAEMSSPFGSRWGRAHDGIDIRSPEGTPFKAAAAGEVVFASEFQGYGKLILIKHPNNYFTAYAHCSKMKVKEGDKVKQSEVIGEVGKTGHATGYHLHFEIRYESTPMDPLDFLPER